MICESYTVERLAAVYDTLNPPGEDMLFYLNLAGREALSILEIGCGTGRLACGLAESGHRVTGTDPARAMLDIARHRPGGERVTWIETHAAGLSLKESFDLIIMTGHVFQVFLSDEEVKAALNACRQQLGRDGRIAFETRNPFVEEWKSWTPELTRERVTVEGLGTVDVHYEVYSREGQLVGFKTQFDFGGGDNVATSNTLRFMPRQEVSAMLQACGFESCEWYGDFDRRPLREDSPEIIVVARKP